MTEVEAIVGLIADGDDAYLAPRGLAYGSVEMSDLCIAADGLGITDSHGFPSI